MSATEDPYETLNIPRNATQSQVKSAYRKLALKYHPDKQTSEDEKRRCGDIFTKIGSAYEILSDQQRRSEYDRFGHGGGNSHQQQSQHQGNTHQDPFMSDFFTGGFMNDPFFSGRGHPNMGSGTRGGFTDPFNLFRQVFGDDYDNQFGFSSFHDHSERAPRDEDYVEQRQSSVGGFEGGMGGFGMGHQMDMMSSMMGRQMGMMNSMPGMHSTNFSSSSSSSFQGTGGMSESVSTSTRIVNGRRQTVTKRTVMKPDGTVETTTETTGDDDFPSLDNSSRSRRRLEGNRGSSNW